MSSTATQTLNETLGEILPSSDKRVASRKAAESKEAASSINPSFVLRAVKDAAIEDRPKPSLRHDHDVIVNIAQTGICGSDVHYWQRGKIGEYILTGPMVLGHESSGVVVEVGAAVTSLEPGDRVALEPGTPCRRCTYCRSGSYHLCGAMVFAATPPYDGTLARYYNNDEDFCYKIPDGMDLEEGAMVEPVSVAVAICKQADLRAHQSVLVLGAGPIGVLCSAVAKQWGAGRVATVDVVQSRLDVAKSYGVDATFIPERPEAGIEPMAHAEKMAALLNKKCGFGDGPDIVLECSGAEPCIQLGIATARKGAVFVQAGMGKEVVAFPITAVCTKGIRIQGSIRYTTGCYPAAIELIAGARIPVKQLITNRFKFEQAEEAFELVRQGRQDVFKVLIEGVQL